jgi:mono/diheme cytochrome c family protein
MKRRRDYPVARGVAPPPGWPWHAAGRVPTAHCTPLAPPALPSPPRFNHWPLRLLFTAFGLLVLAVSAGVGYQVSQLAKQRTLRMARADVAPAAERALPPSTTAAKAVSPRTTEPPRPADAATAKPVAQPTVVESKPQPLPPEPARPVPTFAKDVQPIFQAKCITCHGNNNKKKGDLDLRSLAALHKGGESGSVIVRGQPDKSPLWESVEIGTMPPGKAKLTAAEKDTVRRWIEGGAN